jgi:hypothetical protein
MFWVVPRRVVFNSRRFGTLCYILIGEWISKRLWRLNRHSVPKRRILNTTRRETTQKLHATFRTRRKLEIKKLVLTSIRPFKGQSVHSLCIEYTHQLTRHSSLLLRRSAPLLSSRLMGGKKTILIARTYYGLTILNWRISSKIIIKTQNVRFSSCMYVSFPKLTKQFWSDLFQSARIAICQEKLILFRINGKINRMNFKSCMIDFPILENWHST